MQQSWIRIGLAGAISRLVGPLPSSMNDEIPALLAPAPRPAAWAASTLGFVPDHIQSAVLDSTATRLLLLTTRQWGKTSVAAARALWQAHFHPGSLVLIVAPTEAQGEELNRKIYAFASRLGLSPHGGGRSVGAVHLPNGSRIVGLSEMPANVRGYSAPALILVDEAAFFEGDEILEALMPMLATRPDSAIWLMSTPRGQSGFFYDAWQDAAGPWARIRVTAQEIPDRISAAFLAEQERRNPEKFRREYCCEFIAEQGALFGREQLDGLFTTEVAPLTGSSLYPAQPLQPNLRPAPEPGEKHAPSQPRGR